MSLKRNIHPLIEKEVPSLNNLLDPKDVSAFKELTQELRDTWTKKQIFRTETEMRFSVLNDFKYPTKAAKYWQCVREQNVYLENLMNLSFDYRKEDVKLRQLKQKIKKEKDPLEKELIQIDIDEKNFNKAAMELTAKDRMREIQLWSKIKKEVDDGSFDKDDVNAHQIESYHQIMLNRKNTLTQASTQPEVFNVMGQLDGIEKLKTQKNALENKKREAISSQSSIGAKSK
jgi:hypothetical protein|tara:strand:- start:1338 stop:2027 length:690 start_codon:yes stop_codon:yes gene_type:complete